jgi:RimJ/RimL family protein N-acetyltransferase
MKSLWKSREEILRLIHEIKHQEDPPTIKCNFAYSDYRLSLLTAKHLNNQDITCLLTKWRKQHEWWFPAQFNVTEEGTARWLKSQVIETPDRLLFMIESDGTYIGHIGLFRFDFEKNECEIDNIVRGDDAFPGIMSDAIAQMMQWGRTTLGLRGYELQTFSDNEKSLALYDRLGFREVKRVPLIQVKGEDRVDWIDAPEEYNGSIERYNVFMVLSERQRPGIA